MLNMSDSSRAFLERNLPNALDVEDVNDALDALGLWIDLNGFAMGGLYNEKGREAQYVYDDLFDSND